MGNNTLKKPITKNAVYQRLNQQLQDLDGEQNKRSSLIRIRRKIEDFFGPSDETLNKRQDSDEKHKKRQKAYTQQHYTLLKKVEALEKKMIKEGNE